MLALGISSQKAQALNFHTTTTPQLQYYVYLANVELKRLITDTEEVRSLFWINFSKYFIDSADYLKWKQPIDRVIDCANGVGARALP